MPRPRPSLGDKINRMSSSQSLDRQEYIEQAYFLLGFSRTHRAPNLSAQEILERIHEEILSNNYLLADGHLDSLSTEFKHSGCLSSGFTCPAYYFTPFQAFVCSANRGRGNMLLIPELALLVLEREAPPPPGDFGMPISLFCLSI